MTMTHPLWTGPQISEDYSKIPFPKEIEHHTIHDARTSDYKFLHGPAIIHFKGTFFANWANSPTNENHPGETLQGRRTDHPLNNWSNLEMIGSGTDGLQRHSHGSYLIHNEELWTFPAVFGVGSKGKKFDGLGAEAFVFNETRDLWESKGRVIENCWPYEEPVKMDNGNYIVGGQTKDGGPVVAISQGSNLLKWDTVLIPHPAELKPQYAETTVWAWNEVVMAVIRGGGGVAWIAISQDHGRTWSVAKKSNFPMPRSKAYLGMLSTGQLYLVSNLPGKDENWSRDTLVISVGKPGERSLSTMWKIRQGSSSPIPRFKGHAKGPGWHYPYVYEHTGKLYVVYSIGKEDCGMSIIPIKSITSSQNP